MSTKAFVLIETSVGKITLAAKQVAQVVTKPQVLQQYEASLPKVPNTVEGHLEMARKCRDANLFPQRDFHLQEVLQCFFVFAPFSFVCNTISIPIDHCVSHAIKA